MNVVVVVIVVVRIAFRLCSGLFGGFGGRWFCFGVRFVRAVFGGASEFVCSYRGVGKKKYITVRVRLQVGFLFRLARPKPKMNQ